MKRVKKEMLLRVLGSEVEGLCSIVYSIQTNDIMS